MLTVFFKVSAFHSFSQMYGLEPAVTSETVRPTVRTILACAKEQREMPEHLAGWQIGNLSTDSKTALMSGRDWGASRGASRTGGLNKRLQEVPITTATLKLQSSSYIYSHYHSNSS